MKRVLPLIAAAVSLAACRQANREAGNSAQALAESASAPASPAASLPPDVALAVEIARAVQANPSAADSVLAAHRLSRAGLDSLVYAIAADSAKAAAYSAALR
jgi:hypothetical protein